MMRVAERKRADAAATDPVEKQRPTCGQRDLREPVPAIDADNPSRRVGELRQGATIDPAASERLDVTAHTEEPVAAALVTLGGDNRRGKDRRVSCRNGVRRQCRRD